MKKTFLKLLKIAAGIYLAICTLLYFFQEQLIFLPQTLDQNHTFTFNHEFEEIFIEASDGASLNGLLFKADSSKGLIFYLHGNAGSLQNWGSVAPIYTDLNYDIFILDYRSYGKSEGTIEHESQLFGDNQMVYDRLKKDYSENEIIILGYSIGTGMAAKLAADNSPAQLILQAPYYSLTDMMQHRFSIIPTFLLKYKLVTHQYIDQCTMPITIFHGDSDRIIPYSSSTKLKNEFNDKINLITLKGAGHNGMTYIQEYQDELKGLLK